MNETTQPTGPAGGAQAGDDAASLLARVHRLLRGRYPLTIVLALLGAATGGSIGVISQEPIYRSDGQIRIRPAVGKLLYDTEQSAILPRFASYVASQANYIRTDRVIRRAMQSEAWRRLGRGLDPQEQARFARALDVSIDARSGEWITVSFYDRDPAAAKVAVEEVIRAYEDLAGETELFYSPKKVATLEQRRRELEAAVQRTRGLMQDLAARFGTTDLAARYEEHLRYRQALEDRRRQLEWVLATPEPEPAAVAAATAGHDELLRRYVAQHDPEVAAALQERATWAAELDRLIAAGMGPAHRDRRRAEAQLRAIDQRVAMLVEAFEAANPGAVESALAGADPVVPGAVDHVQARAQLPAVMAQLERATAETVELSRAVTQLEELEARLSQEREELSRVVSRLKQLELESQLETIGVAGRITIVSYGTMPHEPARDDRLKLGAAGAVGGAALPLGLMLLVGLVDRRCRFADEAGGLRLDAPLLGVLPRLPADLRDPEQAAIAGHCVHQIRALLQLGRGASRRVLVMTSPTAGDGKTSLALALGLSFASCGSRTLLIDFDLVGAGLTSALGGGDGPDAGGNGRSLVPAGGGVHDALRSGSLARCVRATPMDRLWYVPVTAEDPSALAQLSPELIRPLIAEARDTYDAVLIDTGPILGSLEASLVCAEADGVILVLGQGQSRTMVERASAMLSAIGAELVGLVFNRARASDFRRAVTSASVRSAPVRAGGGAGRGAAVDGSLGRLGPVARTVAAGLHRDSVDGREAGQ